MMRDGGKMGLAVLIFDSRSCTELTRRFSAQLTIKERVHAKGAMSLRFFADYSFAVLA